eukprot:COSAG06_NODE_3117_length_5834_cov_3.605580_2_plen_129_part_00
MYAKSGVAEGSLRFWGLWPRRQWRCRIEVCTAAGRGRTKRSGDRFYHEARRRGLAHCIHVPRSNVVSAHRACLVVVFRFLGRAFLFGAPPARASPGCRPPLIASTRRARSSSAACRASILSCSRLWTL